MTYKESPGQMPGATTADPRLKAADVTVAEEPDNLLDVLAQIQADAAKPRSSDIRDYVTAEERFMRFHDRNPALYAALRFFALGVVRAGKRVGIKALIERARWEVMLSTTPNDVLTRWKVNNSYAPAYARLLMEQEPELEGFFETRKAAVDSMLGS